MSSSSSVLIKGYLPVRVKIAPTTASDNTSDESFFYVKEHRGTPTESSDNTKNKKGTTLFVANAPVVPMVRTRLLIQSLLGRFGEIARVTVVPNPNNGHVDHSLWTTNFPPPSFLPPNTSEGKFAHVVFQTPKDMRQAMKALTQIMSEPETDPGSEEEDEDSDPVARLPGLLLDKIEIQTLADESDRLYREEMGLEDDEELERKDNARDSTGVLAVAARYRTSLLRLSRDALMEECNTVMEDFENAEEADRSARESAANEPDEDGFVTVSYTSQVGSKRELEETATGQRRRRGQQKRARKKTNDGAKEQENFYRFQSKEKRKESLQELRRRFEDDLAKVKQMKEDQKYRPF
jgi:ribosomal RNA-processing protein 7